MNTMESKKFIEKYYNELKFDVGLDVVLIKDDEEFVKFLIGEVAAYKKLADRNCVLKEQIDQLGQEVRHLNALIDGLKR